MGCNCENNNTPLESASYVSNLPNTTSKPFTINLNILAIIIALGGIGAGIYYYGKSKRRSK